MKKIEILIFVSILFLTILRAASAAAPNVNEVNITPDLAYTNNNLTCTVNSTDADNDTLTNYFNWFVNDSLVFSESPAPEFTFQETADSATDSGAWNDGNYVSYTSISTTKFANYTKPAGSTDAIWQVYYDGGFLQNSNLTIPSDCWDYNSNQLELRLVLDTGAPAVGDHNYSCYNGSWKQIASFNSATYGLVEDGIFWSITGTQSELSSGNFSKNQNVTCQVTSYDGIDNSTSVNDSIIISNTPPQPATNVQPNGSILASDEQINITWTAGSDIDGDSLNYTIWILDLDSYNRTVLGNTDQNVTDYLWNTTVYPEGNYQIIIGTTDGTDYANYRFIDTFSRADSGTVGNTEHPGYSWNEADAFTGFRIVGQELDMDSQAFYMNASAGMQAITGGQFTMQVKMGNLTESCSSILAARNSTGARITGTGSRIKAGPTRNLRYVQNGAIIDPGDTWNTSTDYVLIEMKADLDTDTYDMFQNRILFQDDVSMLDTSDVTEVWLECEAWSQSGNHMDDIIIYTGFTEPSTSNITLTKNTAPNVTNITISPDPAFTNSTLSGSYDYSDAENDSDQSIYSWFVNGSFVSNNQTLDSGNFNKDDQVILQITPYDGTENGTAVNSSTLNISNTAPSSATNLLPNTGDLLSSQNVNVNWSSGSDIDSDTLTYTAFYSADGSTYTTISGTTNLNLTWNAPSDGVFSLKLQTSDGTDAVNLTGGNFTIDTTPPTFSAGTQPTGNYFTTDTIPLLISVDENLSITQVTITYPNSTQVSGSIAYNGTEWYYTGTFTDASAEGTYTVSYNVSDIAGNYNQTTTTFVASIFQAGGSGGSVSSPISEEISREGLPETFSLGDGLCQFSLGETRDNSASDCEPSVRQYSECLLDKNKCFDSDMRKEAAFAILALLSAALLLINIIRKSKKPNRRFMI